GEAEQEGRVGELEHEPGLVDGLHPRPRLADDGTGEVDAVVPLAKRAEPCGKRHASTSLAPRTRGLRRRARRTPARSARPGSERPRRRAAIAAAAPAPGTRRRLRTRPAIPT